MSSHDIETGFMSFPGFLPTPLMCEESARLYVCAHRRKYIRGENQTRKPPNPVPGIQERSTGIFNYPVRFFDFRECIDGVFAHVYSRRVAKPVVHAGIEGVSCYPVFGFPTRTQQLVRKNTIMSRPTGRSSVAATVSDKNQNFTRKIQ